jgi:hypothetical protein
MNCFNCVDNGYETNQIYNAATAVFVGANCIVNPNLKDLTDMTIHAAQALLRKDGYFGVKIDSLGIDVKLIDGKKGRLIMDIANMYRLGQLITDTSSELPIAIKVIDMYNHLFNFLANRSVK